MRWDNVTQTLTHIAREPVDPDRIYTLVVNEQLLRGMDALHVLLDYLRAHPEAVDISQPRVEIKARLASHWLGELSANKMLPSDLLQISVDGNIQLPAASNLPLHKHLVGETFAL